MKNLLTACVAAAGILGGSMVGAIVVDVDSDASVKSAASIVAFNLMKYYTGNETGDVPGNLPDPYYWWQCGAMFGSMIDYWYYTGDTTYNDVVSQGLLHQVGAEKSFMPINQTRSLGNDDQAFWGMTAMAAAETKFQDPPADQPQWLALAQAVFNSQAVRWDDATCAGGLKWQIFPFNPGYTYKNAISNGAFFNIAARLATYTGNKTYADWADKVWDWMEHVRLIDDTYNVYDGSDDTKNCTDFNGIQWTYNAGIFLSGAAFMYKYTNESSIWKTRTEGLLKRTLQVFFNEAGIMYEICESSGSCNHDQYSFKAYLSRWLAATSEIAPFTSDAIMPFLRTSAVAAAKQCSGGDNGVMCGARWTQNSTWDGSQGVGQQMCALEAIQSTLMKKTAGLVTNQTGGTSVGDPSAGSGGGRTPVYTGSTGEITTGDKVGAGILSTLVLVSLLGGTWFMISE